MKRTALIKHVEQHGCELPREGKKLSIYWNPLRRRTSAVPRHIVIEDTLARKICRDLEFPEP